MSDEDDQQPEIIKPPPREEQGKRFFISHLNSYTGRALCKELKNEHTVREPEWASHTFSGTQMDVNAGGQRLDTIDGMPSNIHTVSMERTQEFRKTILSSDVIIYDLISNKYEEVDYVIKTLKTAELGEGQNKTLILLSSVMTWVNTPQKFKQEGAEEVEGEGEAEAEGEPEGEEEPPELDANGEPIPKKKV